MNELEHITPEELSFMAGDEAREIRNNASRESTSLGHNEEELKLYVNNSLNEGTDKFLKEYEKKYIPVTDHDIVIIDAFRKEKIFN